MNIPFDKITWTSYCSNQQFQNFVQACRAFDPEGYDRAILQDEASGSFDFRRVVVEVFISEKLA
jgi:hypothetical protein